MESIKYILAISIISIFASPRMSACGPYYPEDPMHLRMFRCCTPELERQWEDGCRFQEYEKEENCYLWQKITSTDIPLKDIERLVYDARLTDLRELPDGRLRDNKFAEWLLRPNHKDDWEYILIAKEIEEIREYMANPWYYAYEGDDEHKRLDKLKKKCIEYKGQRHADRYALQITRLYFAQRDFQRCIDLWETSVSKMPRNIVTDMISSYVGGAYSRKGYRDKAIELFTRSQDIGSLINLKTWDVNEVKSDYTDPKVRELEYIFNRFPNSPLLSIKLQKYVRKRGEFVYGYRIWGSRDFHDPIEVQADWVNDSTIIDDDRLFYNELKQFANTVISSSKCRQKGMWNYALAYLYYLEGNKTTAQAYLSRAEHSEATPFIKESIRAFRFLFDASLANNSPSYRSKLLRELKWLDERMKRDVELKSEDDWQYDNKMNYSFYYWQDVARKVLLGEVCPRIGKSGNTTLALQLANYATNRIHQLAPLYEAYHSGWNDKDDSESYTTILPFDEFRKTWTDTNWFDYSNQFFDWINGVSATDAAKYAERIIEPSSALDKFLNERSYVDTDYIYDIVGTLYLREMNYDKAVYWLSKVSKSYQSRTNIAKDGYFKLDPFRFQFDKEQYIADSSDYKLRFAQEMQQLEALISSDAEVNRKADAKIRYAIGLRNSFGRCWYLTQYGYELNYVSEYSDWECHTSIDREGFKNNAFAQKAYKKVDALMAQAISEYTDPEQAAQAQLEMMNFKTLVTLYPGTKAADYIRTHCDNLSDYAIQKR